MARPKVHMASRAVVEYDLIGRETGVTYDGPPKCCRRVLIDEYGRAVVSDSPPKQTRFTFDVTCKRCIKLIQDARNAEYRNDQEAKNMRLGRPTTPEDDYVSLKWCWHGTGPKA